MKPILFIFDLDTKRAQRMFGSKYHPYARIESFVRRFGFFRTQGSAFENREGMSASQQAIFLQAIADELPWFSRVARNVKLVEVANDIDCLSVNPRQYQLPFSA